jgi:hypothetical protein
MIQLAWLWLRHQPQSELSRWFHKRLANAGKGGRKTTIVALARKLLVALWKYVTAGVVIEGAVMKTAAIWGPASPSTLLPIRRGPISLGRSGRADR